MRPVTLELPELRGVNMSQIRSRGSFAVAEALPSGQRVICFTDDRDEAAELAAQLRRRGIRAGAFQTTMSPS
ncbi:MAG TPA: hypothetical protein VK425_12070 [Acidimicrobiales bacterium]|nr:hypothetical protein [Acidimicrobiales bacterium]